MYNHTETQVYIIWLTNLDRSGNITPDQIGLFYFILFLFFFFETFLGSESISTLDQTKKKSHLAQCKKLGLMLKLKLQYFGHLI